MVEGSNPSLVNVNQYSTMYLKFITICDAPESWQLGLQDPATHTLEGMVFFQDYLNSYMIIIGICLFFLLYTLYILFDKKINFKINEFTQDNLLEIVWTILSAFVLLLLAIPSFTLLYSLDELFNSSKTFKVLDQYYYCTFEHINLSLAVLISLKPLQIKEFLNNYKKGLLVYMFFLVFTLTFLCLGLYEYFLMLGLLNKEYNLLKALSLNMCQFKMIVIQLRTFYIQFPEIEVSLGWFVLNSFLPFKMIIPFVYSLLAYFSIDYKTCMVNEFPGLFNSGITCSNQKYFFFDINHKIIKSIDDLNLLIKEIFNDKHTLTLKDVQLIVNTLEKNRTILLESLSSPTGKDSIIFTEKFLKVNELLFSIIKRIENICIKLQSNDSLLLHFKEVNDAMDDWGILFY